MSKSSSEPEKIHSSDGKIKDEAARLDKRYRHSLQPKSEFELPPSSLRHTQSHRYDSKEKKKTKGSVTVSHIAAILEAENSEDEIEKATDTRKEKTKNSTVVYENEKRSRKTSKTRKTDSNNKAVFSFENSAFEGNMHTKRNSNTTIRTNSSRAPSVQSLEVVREQYCCCAKRTKCERTLLTVVTVLSIIIIVLIIVVVILAKHNDLDELRMNYLKL